MTLKQDAIRGTFWSAVQLWGQQIVSLLLFVVLVRLLKPDDFGLVALAFTFIAFIQIFLDQGLGAAIIQIDEVGDTHLSTAFWVNLLFGIAMMVLTIVSASMIAHLFRNSTLTPILIGLSPIFVIRSFSAVQEALLKRNLEFRLLALRTLIGTVSGGIVGVGMGLAGFGAWSLVGLQLVTGIVATCILWVMSPFRPTLVFSRIAFRQLFGFGKHVVGAEFANYFNRNADDLLIGYFLGTTVLGYYTVAYRILRVMVGLLTGVINAVAFPVFARMQDDVPRVRKSFYTAVQLTAAIAFPVFIGMALIAPEFVRVFYGTGWEPSIPVMQVLAFIGILQAIYYFNTSVLLASGKSSWSFFLTAINAIANVIAFLIAVPWGIVAVASAYVLRGYLLSPFPLMAVKRLIHIKYGIYLRLLVGPLFGCTTMTIVVLAAKHWLWSNTSDVSVLVGSLVVGVLVYGLSLYATAPLLIPQMLDMVRLLKPSKHAHQKA
jgi:PST family polysaccharide transporter